MEGLAPVRASTIVGYKPAYMAFLHMWMKEARKSGGVGYHARASLYMVEHWERHLYGGGQESGDSRRS